MKTRITNDNSNVFHKGNKSNGQPLSKKSRQRLRKAQRKLQEKEEANLKRNNELLSIASSHEQRVSHVTNHNNNNRWSCMREEKRDTSYHHNHHRRHERQQQSHEHPLNSTWKIYIHDCHDKDWSDESYMCAHELKTLEDYAIFFSNYNNFKSNQYYIMRNDIKPQYEDPSNLGGGTFSIIVSNDNEMTRVIHLISARIVCETMTKTLYQTMMINGFSISPKISNDGNTVLVISIWTTRSDVNFNRIGLERYTIKYRSHNFKITKQKKDTTGQSHNNKEKEYISETKNIQPIPLEEDDPPVVFVSKLRKRQ